MGGLCVLDLMLHSRQLRKWMINSNSSTIIATSTSTSRRLCKWSQLNRMRRSPWQAHGPGLCDIWHAALVVAAVVHVNEEQDAAAAPAMAPKRIAEIKLLGDRSSQPRCCHEWKLWASLKCNSSHWRAGCRIA
jgi:hypothetical protein